MTLPLAGKRIALAEGRQLEELAAMLEKEGAVVLRCPLVSILDAPNQEAVLAWLRDLCARVFDYVVLFTGEGLRRLLDCADRAGLRAQVIAALAQNRVITRGPKPVRALKEVGLTPAKVAEAPTTDGVIATLRREELAGKTLGVQLFGAANSALEAFLVSAKAVMAPVTPYVYAPAADAERVADLVQSMARGRVDAVVFTSSPQIDRLYEVVQERKLEQELASSWQRTKVAAIGPVVAETLRRHGAPIHICPEQGFVMKNLVKRIRDAFAV